MGSLLLLSYCVNILIQDNKEINNLIFTAVLPFVTKLYTIIKRNNTIKTRLSSVYFNDNLIKYSRTENLLLLGSRLNLFKYVLNLCLKF